MRNDVSAVLVAACLVAVVWTVVLAVRDRRVSNALLIELCVTEFLVIVQLVVALVSLGLGRRPESTATFLAYAVAAVLVLPVGTLWSVAERSRSSTLVITIACLALPVMTARMLQMWGTVPA